MSRKKNLLAQDTHLSLPQEELVVEKAATIHAGYQPRLEAHGKSKALTRKAVGIGRDKQNGVIIADAKVSRFHAVLNFRKGEAFIRDIGSTNGTTVNGVLIQQSRSTALKDKDVVVVGSTRLTIRY